MHAKCFSERTHVFLGGMCQQQAWHARDKKTGKEYVIKTVDISKMSKKERDASRKEVQILGTTESAL